MPIYRGTQRVTPRPGGQAVARVYRGDRLVWQAAITVTPQAPTFHDGEPWYTLPAQDGVTYSVSGTPGYGQAVTITATAQPGYELVGESVWQHTFGPPPRYSASGSGGGIPRLTQNVWTTVTTHTVSATGTSSGTWQVWWRSVYNGNVDIRVLRNGVSIASSNVNNPQSSPYTQSVTIPTIDLVASDALTFQALYNAAGGASSRYVDSWSWSLS